MLFFTNGMYMSVPMFNTFVRYNVYPTAIISKPSIFAFGLSPFVFFNTNFLKSSINPISPKPTAVISSGKIFLAIVGSNLYFV